MPLGSLIGKNTSVVEVGPVEMGKPAGGGGFRWKPEKGIRVSTKATLDVDWVTPTVHFRASAVETWMTAEVHARVSTRRFHREWGPATGGSGAANRALKPPSSGTPRRRPARKSRPSPDWKLLQGGKFRTATSASSSPGVPEGMNLGERHRRSSHRRGGPSCDHARQTSCRSRQEAARSTHGPDRWPPAAGR